MNYITNVLYYNFFEYRKLKQMIIDGNLIFAFYKDDGYIWCKDWSDFIEKYTILHKKGL